MKRRSITWLSRFLLPGLLLMRPPAAHTAPATALEQAVRQLTSRGAPSVVLVEGAQPLSSWEARAGRVLGRADSSIAPTRGWVVSTGVIVDRAGLIAAYGDKLPGCTHYQVRTQEGRVVPAQWVGYDEPSGLALLKAHGVGSAATPRPEELPSEGEWVAILSRAPGGALSASVGLAMHSMGGKGSIATTAATGPRGGVMVDGQGRWMGLAVADQPVLGRYSSLTYDGAPILSHAWSRSEVAMLSTSVNVAAVPNPDRGYLGVRVEPAPPAAAGGFGSVRITGVVPGSPAALAGLRLGDVVSRINGRAVDDVEQFSERVTRAAPGSRINLSLGRGPTLLEKELRMGTVPAVTAEDTISAQEMFQTEYRRFKARMGDLRRTITGH